MKSFEYNFFGDGSDQQASFGCFSFEPGNIYEKKSGNLYTIGLLASPLPQDQKFLKDLASKIRENHYVSKYKTPEKSLNASLQLANTYLDDLVKQGSVSWMGNLNFAAFAVRNLDFYFTRTGAISIYLLRQGAIVDLAKDIDAFKANPGGNGAESHAQDGDEYSSRMFGSLVSGKLEEGDAIMALTRDVAEFVKKFKLGPQIAAVVAPPDKSQQLSNRSLEQIFGAHKADFGNITGCCLIISLRSDLNEIVNHDFSSESHLKQVSMREMFKVKGSAVPVLSVSAPRFSLKMPRFNFLAGALAVFALGAILAGGFWFFTQQRTGRDQAYRQALETIRQEASAAFAQASAGDPALASERLRLSLASLDELKKAGGSPGGAVASEIENLNADITRQLADLNKVDDVQARVIFEFTDFSPERMAAAGGNLFFYNPATPDIYKLLEDSTGSILPNDRIFNAAASSDGKVFFYTDPAQVTIFDGAAFSKTVRLKEPYANFNFDHFYAYKQNLYFVDKTAGKIIKYPSVGQGSWGQPQLWLAAGAKKPANEASLAFDKSAWVLNADGSIDKYFTGKDELTLAVNYYPAPQAMDKIVTSAQLPYLYLMESGQNRIVILAKDGRLVKQITSGQFAGMKDFDVSPDGKIITVLAGNKLLEIDISY